MSYTIVTSIALFAAAQAQAGPARATASDASSSLRPTQIRLDFKDLTLAQIVEHINAQAPASVVCRPDSKVAVGGELPKTSRPMRRFTLLEPESISFWEAIDRVCCATSSWPLAEPQSGPAGQAPGPRVVVVPAAPDRGFVCNDGAFRIALTGLIYVRDIRFTPLSWPQPEGAAASRDGPSDQTLFSAELHVMAEPRLRIQRFGGLAIRQAVDDQGRDLIHSGSRAQSPNIAQGVIHQGGMSMWAPLPLSYPGNPGKLIKRLSGSISLEVSRRAAGSRPDSTEVTFDFTQVPMP
jgi:hypothetical protein